MRNAELRVIPGVWGHFAGGGDNPTDVDVIDAAVKELLQRLTRRQGTGACLCAAPEGGPLGEPSGPLAPRATAPGRPMVAVAHWGDPTSVQ